jgi:hypothetical protein
VDRFQCIVFYILFSWSRLKVFTSDYAVAYVNVRATTLRGFVDNWLDMGSSEFRAGPRTVRSRMWNHCAPKAVELYDLGASGRMIWRHDKQRYHLFVMSG